MTTPQCPKCRQPISADDVNVGADVAFCRRCNLAARLSDAVHGTQLDHDVDVSRPPAGAWYRDAGHKTIIGATHRSIPTALAMLAFALFWNGIVSVFLLVVLSSTLSLAGVSVPEWFPAPKMNGSTMGVGMTIFLWIFLTPFILIGATMIYALFAALWGCTEIEITAGDVAVFDGVGSFGRRKRFPTAGVRNVTIETTITRTRKGGEHERHSITIARDAEDAVQFGGSLSEMRRKFVAAALRKHLIESR